MNYASILAAVTGAADDADAVALAAEITAREAASLRILTAFPIMESGFAMVGGSPRAAAELGTVLVQYREDRSRQTLAIAERETDRFGLTHAAGASRAWAMADAAPTPWLGLLEQLPLADLLVVAQSTTCADGPWTGFLSDALIGARAPVLVSRGGASPFGRTAAVAWDGSLQAGRAVHAALPLLRKASDVAILQDEDGLDTAVGTAADPDRLADHLSRHGVAGARVVRLRGRDEGAALISAAASVGAALLVAGGFGHARLREAVFGGATRSFLAADGPHLLLAH